MGRILGFVLFITAGVAAGCRQADVAAEQSGALAPEAAQSSAVHFVVDERRHVPYLVAHGQAREELRAAH
ncbi:MAG TPA: hypothetical protein PJ986_11285 [Gammaproteobacteria bacterium]|nr:hypothetical protein [Gammaproteobacteria bacterium]